MTDPEDPVPYTQAVHDAIAPIQHLEDDAMVCVGFAIEADRHATYGCPCGAEAVTRPTGSTAWLVIHRRWDGRDLLQRRQAS